MVSKSAKEAAIAFFCSSLRSGLSGTKQWDSPRTFLFRSGMVRRGSFPSSASAFISASKMSFTVCNRKPPSIKGI